MAEDANRPTIPEFYSGRTLFITGFTGFMGKVLVEKLLWSCSDIKRIYVLLRSKRGLTPQQRIDKIINSDLFERLKTNKNELLSKIVGIDGDVTLPSLGIPNEMREKLKNEVSIIFHCAASVRFDDPLPLAIDINVKGTKSTVELAHEMPNLVAFVHVSTAYSNCDKFDIEEKVYPPHAEWDETLQIREKLDEATLNVLSKKYMNHLPNTPSIVVSTYHEPFPGWIDNLNGPTGLLGGYGTGVVRTCILDSSIMPDFIPVDIAIRGLIVTAYARVYKKDEGIHFYNWCTRDRSVTYKDLIDMGKKLIEDAPMKYVLWTPSTHTTSSKIWFLINFLLFQVVPAFFIDIILRVVGQKPMLWKLQRRVYIAMDALSYFTLNYFHFDNKNGYALMDFILPSDKDEFDYNIKPEEVDEYTFFYNSTLYFQKRFLKMKPEDVEFGKKLRTVMMVADKLVKTMFWTYLAYLVYQHRLIQSICCKTFDFITIF